MSRLKEATYDLLDALEERAKFRLIARVFDDSLPMTTEILVDAKNKAVCLVGAAIPKSCYTEWHQERYLTEDKREVLFNYWAENDPESVEDVAESAWDEAAKTFGITNARLDLQGYILEYIEDRGSI